MRCKLDPGAIMPTRAHPTDAGLDIFSPVDFTIWPNGRACIDTGVHIQLPPGYFGRLASKSGLMKDLGITADGLIDEPYTGSIKAVLFNHTNKIIYFKRGQKLTQLVVEPCIYPELTLVDELEETDRGEAGFGSTGLF